MEERAMLKAFWGCGDNEIIEYAVIRARLNRHEKEAVRLVLDECYTQEEASEVMCVSVRRFQEYWYGAMRKLLGIPWVTAYAKELI